MIEIRFKDGRRPSARYVSGTTVREEALDSTRLIGLYWSASGQVHRENVAASLPGLDPIAFRLEVFDLEIDGQELHNRWDWVAGSERPGAREGTREGVIELRHQVRPVTLKVITRLDGTPFLVRYLEVTNAGAAPAALSRVSPWSGMLWSYKEADGLLPAAGSAVFSLGYLDSVVSGTEGNFVWQPLRRGTSRIESASGRSGYGCPYFIVRNEMTGQCALCALAWSGNWYAEFWNDPHLTRDRQPEVNLLFRMGPTGPAPLRVIAPGETVRTPETHLAVLHGDFDECIQAMHEHLRVSVIPPLPRGKEMYTTAGRVVEKPGEWILREIDIAAEMGVEGFMVDAGWYGEEFGNWTERRGDWEEGNWIPGGLAACRERAHRHGLLFGLWMEPESIGAGSRLLQQHPEWVLSTDNGRRVALALDLGNEEAARYVSDCILRVIREHQPDYFKLDYNVEVHEGGQRIRDGYAEHEAWRHYEAIYQVFERVREEFPEIVLENCSSGGGRNDLGMMSRFHYTVESDYSLFPQSIRAINGLTLLFPPEAICYYHNHVWFAHQRADLDTHLRVALFARTVFVGFGAQDADRSCQHFERTRRYIRLAKEFARPIFAGHPRVFHHTPDTGVLGPAEWCVLEYAARDGLAGYAGVFRVGTAVPEAGARDSSRDEYVFRPRGLDPSRRYLVTLDNLARTIECDGADLIRHGIATRLDQLHASELLLFVAKAD